MIRIITVLLLTYCSSLSLFAQNIYEANDPRDTVFLEMTSDRDFTIIHKVGVAETVQSLSNLFGVSTTQIYANNGKLPSSNSIPLKKESLVRIPINNDLIIKDVNQLNEYPNAKSIFYIVKPNETLYRIAKTRLNIPLEELKLWNGMTSNNIHPKDLIRVGWFDLDYSRQKRVKQKREAYTIINEELAGVYKKQRDYTKEHKQAGAAVQASAKSTRDDYVMHRTAKIGSIVSIINPMNKHVAFAEVIGRIPLTHDKSVMLVVPSILAKKLGVRDNKFYVKMRYIK